MKQDDQRVGQNLVLGSPLGGFADHLVHYFNSVLLSAPIRRAEEGRRKKMTSSKQAFLLKQVNLLFHTYLHIATTCMSRAKRFLFYFTLL